MKTIPNAIAFFADEGVRDPTMNDFKNFLIAYFSSVPSVFAAIETRTLVTVISAIILPILFFTVGKTIDVVLQIYLDKRRQKGDR